MLWIQRILAPVSIGTEPNLSLFLSWVWLDNVDISTREKNFQTCSFYREVRASQETKDQTHDGTCVSILVA